MSNRSFIHLLLDSRYHFIGDYFRLSALWRNTVKTAPRSTGCWPRRSAAVILDDSARHRQPESRPLPNILGCERKDRISVADARRNSAAAVRYTSDYEFSVILLGPSRRHSRSANARLGIAQMALIQRLRRPGAAYPYRPRCKPAGQQRSRRSRQCGWPPLNQFGDVIETCAKSTCWRRMPWCQRSATGGQPV